MKVAIAITAWNRPEELRYSLWSIGRQLDGPWHKWPVYLHVDGGGGREKEVREVAMTTVGVANRIRVRFETENHGTNLNTYETMKWIWSEGFDWAVYLEDDFVLSPDALRLAAWYIEKSAEIESLWSVDGIGAYCLCNLEGDASHPSMVQLSRAFIGWGFVMSRAQWEQIEPAWCSGEKDDPPSMWDRHVARRIRRGPHIYNAIPVLSRVRNIGTEGVHCTPEKHAKQTANMEIATERKKYEFSISGWDEIARRYRWDKLGLGESLGWPGL